MVRKLYRPSTRSHKGQNGEVLVIGGSARYHGAPLMAARMAAKLVDFVYFYSTPENKQLVRKMKNGLAEFIAVPRQLVYKYAVHSDVILIGPGLGLDQNTRRFVNSMLKKFPHKKFVLDAGALRLVNTKLLPLRLRGRERGLRAVHNSSQPPLILRGGDGVRCILTPHRQEFRAAFAVAPTPANVQAMVKEYQCVIVLKGPEDIICSPRGCLRNKTGNAGMTKGGTGDVLSGLIAGLAAKNDLFLAVGVGAYINGLAGDQLKKRMSYYFSASDLIAAVPKVLKKLG